MGRISNGFGAAGRRLLGELAAIGRELVKDVRNANHELWFGKQEHASEPGTPLNPTPQIITQELGRSPYQHALGGNSAERQEETSKTNEQEMEM